MVFRDGWEQYNRPGKIVTLGDFYPQALVGEAKGRLREARAHYGDPAVDLDRVSAGIAWTRLIGALNKGRRWPQRRVIEMLGPMLSENIAVAVVPSHVAYAIDAPLREVARRLVSDADRVDATECLERQTTIRRILYGGPSTRALHRETIRVVRPDLVVGREVLLLDDVAKSGASLVACRALLLEAGAERVQAVALGRVVVSLP